MKDRYPKSMLKLSKWIVKQSVWILLVVLLLTIFFGYELTKIQFDSDIFNALPKKDKVAQLYREVGKKYGGNYMAMIILKADDVFTPKVLADIRDLTDSLQVIKGVSYVTSLTNIIDIKSTEFGIEVGKLVDEYNLPQTKAELDSLRQRVMSDSMYNGVIVSSDGKYTLVVVAIQQDADKQEVAKAIKKKVEELNLSEKIYYTGVPFILLQTNEILHKDLAILTPIAALIIAIVLFIGFRSVRGVVMPLLAVGIAIIWTIGLMAWWHYKLTLSTNIIPVVLLALGSAYTIHVLNRINEERFENYVDKIIYGLAFIIIPVFLAYITTAFGFISFVFGSYLITIKNFGIFSAIGITLAFLLAITFVPAFIKVFHYERKKKYEAEKLFVIKKLLVPISDSVINKPVFTIILWLLVAVIIGFGITQIHREVDMSKYYKKGSEIQKQKTCQVSS